MGNQKDAQAQIIMNVHRRSDFGVLHGWFAAIAWHSTPFKL
jgi:hypothetical protein